MMEVGVAYTALDGDPSTPAGLLAALAERRDRAGPGDLLRAALDPVAKVVQRVRGNGRVEPVASAATRDRPA